MGALIIANDLDGKKSYYCLRPLGYSVWLAALPFPVYTLWFSLYRAQSTCCYQLLSLFSVRQLYRHNLSLQPSTYHLQGRLLRYPSSCESIHEALSSLRCLVTQSAPDIVRLPWFRRLTTFTRRS